MQMKKTLMVIALLAATLLAWDNPGTPLYSSGGTPVTYVVDSTGVVRWLMADTTGVLMVAVPGEVTMQSVTLMPMIDTVYCANGVTDTLVFAEPAAVLCIQNADAANDLYFSFDNSTYATIFPECGFSMNNLYLDTLFLTASAGGTLAEIVTQIQY